MPEIKKDQLRCLIEGNKLKTELVLQPRGTSNSQARRTRDQSCFMGPCLPICLGQILNTVHGCQPLISLYFFFFKVALSKVSIETSD